MTIKSAIRGRQSARATVQTALTAGCWLPTTGVNPLRLNNLRISLMDSRFCREFLSKSLIPGDGLGGRDKQAVNGGCGWRKPLDHDRKLMAEGPKSKSSKIPPPGLHHGNIDRLAQAVALVRASSDKQQAAGVKAAPTVACTEVWVELRVASAPDPESDQAALALQPTQLRNDERELDLSRLSRADVILPDLVEQRLVADVQLAGGAFAIPGRLFQHLRDDFHLRAILQVAHHLLQVGLG